MRDIDPNYPVDDDSDEEQQAAINAAGTPGESSMAKGSTPK